jgi:PAS domain S-box-containing protein
MLNRQLANSLASFLLFEEEVDRSKREAAASALQREALSQQLEEQTSRMRRMTELSPLGMYLFDPQGYLIEANERFYDMTGHPKDEETPYQFIQYMADPESEERVQKLWWSLIEDPTRPRTAELHLQTPKNPDYAPRDLNGEPIECWVLASSQPEVGPDGSLKAIMGSIADISQLKWVQGLQNRRLKEAEETKRRQNEFIDITSHEMRNPLSVILISADDIRNTLTQHSFTGPEAQIASECIEAANNIALCVQHQRTIVDDILTISKLDSNLLTITPVPVQPAHIVQTAMNMFKPEGQAKDISLNYCPAPSLKDLNVDWVNLDPGRILQITVNLVTNAIKFTQASQKRKISVHLSVSLEPPTKSDKAFEYVPTRTGNGLIDIKSDQNWGQGELLYVRIDVEDTGCGLTPEEKQVLFGRFAQASPRTYTHYGGSGLGLWISRQLVELHGGQIGVYSEPGKGSKFGFFVQARRTTAEAQPASPWPATGQKSIHAEQVLEKSTPAIVVTMHPSTDELPKSDLPTNTDALSNNTAALSANTAALSANTAAHSPSTVALSPGTAALSKSAPARAKPSHNKEESVASEDGVLHVLIVEDNLVNQRVLTKQLRKVGFVVHTADDGQQALDHLATTRLQREGGTPLSFILMDLNMPVMDGLTCMARIREMEREGTSRGHVPIIAFTANVRDEQQQEAIETGADDVVTKLSRIPELLARITAVLKRLEGA